MTKFNESLLQAMKEMLQARGYGVERVTGYEEVEKSDGYCETCYYEYTEVQIDFIDSNNKAQTYEYSGSFAELIQELTHE